jgi:hypothetical protein
LAAGRDRDGRHTQLLVQLIGTAAGTAGRLAGTDEQLELVAALAALIFINRHRILRE